VSSHHLVPFKKAGDDVSNSKRRAAARNSDEIDYRLQAGLTLAFPLFVHWANRDEGIGRWGKKVRGKLHYFGAVKDDPKGESALRKWLDEKDDLLAGRTPRTKTDGLTVAELCDRFIQSKDRALESGQISQHTRNDYKETTDRLVAFFGKNRLVTDLAADDFEALQSSIAKNWGPVALGNEIQRVHVVFKYGYDTGLLNQPMRYGPAFKRPSKKVLRLARAAKGPRLFEPAELKQLIESADAQLKAMIQLGINCGFGNSDCGTLPIAALELDGAWVNYHRPKTGIDRRCPLWPETVTAIKAALAKRPTPKSKEAERMVFVTKYGATWAGSAVHNPVSREFGKLAKEQQVARTFYDLRHTFRTVADECRDQAAVNSIMGHADASMAATYRERIADERLRAAADHVRAWLYPDVVAKERAEREAAAAKAKPHRAKQPKPSQPRTGGARNTRVAEKRQEPHFALRIVGL
jgi:integrase